MAEVKSPKHPFFSPQVIITILLHCLLHISITELCRNIEIPCTVWVKPSLDETCYSLPVLFVQAVVSLRLLK